MAKQLFSDPEAEQEAFARDRDLRGELSLVREELELFQHPAWGMFATRLGSLVSKDMESLVSCPTEEVAPTRARIKAYRHLLGLEASLRGKEADLRAALAAPEDEDDDD